MKTLEKAVTIACIGLGFTVTGAHAATISEWTFESSIPSAAGPFAP